MNRKKCFTLKAMDKLVKAGRWQREEEEYSSRLKTCNALLLGCVNRVRGNTIPRTYNL